MFCGACSQQMNAEARFCSHCGTPVQPRAWTNYNGRVVRPYQGRMIAGVCAGIADAHGLDRGLVRLIAVLLLICGHGLTLIAYVVAWIALPNASVWYVPPVPPQGYGAPPAYGGATGYGATPSSAPPPTGSAPTS
jgi:phage shock protein C